MHEHFLELVMPKTIKLLGKTQKNVNKDTNGEDLSNLKVTDIL